MLTRYLAAALLAAVVLVPTTAAADPVTIGLFDRAGGNPAFLQGAAAGVPFSMGAVTLPSAGAPGIIALSSLPAPLNHSAGIAAGIAGSGGSSGAHTARAGGVGGLHDGGGVVPAHQPGVPQGHSGSDAGPGATIAQSAALERSAVFAGGRGSVMANDRSSAADVLLFTGLAGASGALRVTFGLHDGGGGGTLFARLSAEEGASPSPEPASLLLIGTGLAGLAAARRRRRAAGAIG